MAETQLTLPLVQYKLEQEVIYQRVRDGYVNATAMCKAAGKLFGHYKESKQTTAFLKALEADIGIPISQLVQSIKGGAPTMQGTRFHSPKRCSQGIQMPWLRRGNRGKIVPTWFV